MTEQLNYHKLVNLKKRMGKYDCEYSKKILATIEECIVDAKAVSKKREDDRRTAYKGQEVLCDDCGVYYDRDAIYRHRKDKHGHISKRTTEYDPCAVLLKCLADAGLKPEDYKVEPSSK